MRYKYLIEKYSYLLALAGLQEELEQLPIEQEVKNFISTITESKFKGKIFSEVKKNKNINIEDLRRKLADYILEEEIKNKLRDSSLPEEWLKIINNYSGRLQTYLRALARGNKLPQLNAEILDKLSKINHFVEQHRDNPIDNFSFEDLAEIAIDWEESFKQPKATTNYEKLDIVYGPNWKNNNYNGYYITEVTTKDDLFLEGTLLDHCVKGSGYYQKVKNKETRIFSLRDPSGRPLITMDVSPDLYNFKQTFGYNNAQPSAAQNSMINEWKQSLHPKDKILQLTESSVKDKIKAAQFMDYNDPDYRLLIDKMLLEEKNSGKGFIGSQVENSPKDVLQALAANETLSEQCYERIYAKCAYNTSTVYCLIRNPNIVDNLFNNIYLKNKDNDEILSYIASSFKLPRSSQADQIIDYIVELGLKNTRLLNVLFNNPSIPSSKIKPILDNLDKKTIIKIFKGVSDFDSKFIDDILESNNPNLKDYYFSILLKNDNLNPKVLEKLYKKYGKPGVVFNRFNLLKTVITRGVSLAQLSSLNDRNINNYLAKHPNLTPKQSDQPSSLNSDQTSSLNNDINLSRNPNLTPGQINELLALNDNDINYNLATRPNLTSEQIDVLLAANNKNINKNLAENPNLTPEQIDQLLSLNRYNINYNLAIRPNLTLEQIDKLLSLKDESINYNLAKNPNLTLRQVDQLLSLNNYVINDNLAQNPNLTLDQALLLIKNKIIPANFLAKNALQNNKTASKYDKLLKIANNYKFIAEKKYYNLLHYYNSSY